MLIMATNKALQNRINQMIELNRKMSELLNEYDLDSSKVKEKSFMQSIDTVLSAAEQIMKKNSGSRAKV